MTGYRVPLADDDAPTADVIRVLVANHRELLAFVERRVGNRAVAEETWDQPHQCTCGGGGGGSAHPAASR